MHLKNIFRSCLLLLALALANQSRAGDFKRFIYTTTGEDLNQFTVMDFLTAPNPPAIGGTFYSANGKQTVQVDCYQPTLRAWFIAECQTRGVYISTNEEIIALFRSGRIRVLRGSQIKGRYFNTAWQVSTSSVVHDKRQSSFIELTDMYNYICLDDQAIFKGSCGNGQELLITYEPGPTPTPVTFCTCDPDGAAQAVCGLVRGRKTSEPRGYYYGFTAQDESYWQSDAGVWYFSQNGGMVELCPLAQPQPQQSTAYCQPSCPTPQRTIVVPGCYSQPVVYAQERRRNSFFFNIGLSFMPNPYMVQGFSPQRQPYYFQPMSTLQRPFQWHGAPTVGGSSPYVWNGNPTVGGSFAPVGTGNPTVGGGGSMYPTTGGLGTIPGVWFPYD